MPSLRQILAVHAPLLLIDAASSEVHAGWFDEVEKVRWTASVEESGVAVFRCIEELGIDPGKAGAFLFCEGPGSALGVRIAAMAIRVWCVAAPRPIFAYRSLELVAETEAPSGAGIIADARRDSWHLCTRDNPLRRVPAEDLAGKLLMPEGFRHWSPLPAGVEFVPYDPPGRWRRAADAALFRETDAPDSFQHEERNFAAWAPKIHRAPKPREPSKA
jgi:tRNA threonylcarbamoyladenosine biosynthesis protein TsaB